MIARTLALLMLVYIPMLGEAARATRNERRQRARGGIEPDGDVYAAMSLAYPGCFLAMIAESVVTGRVVGAPLVWFGVVLFAAAKLLKWWAIVSLADCWNFRVIVVPGDHPVTSGPYRFLSHPNYVAVIGELVSVAILAGARLTGPIAVTLFSLLIWRRIIVERRALDAILRPS
jgi:methyltransferase